MITTLEHRFTNVEQLGSNAEYCEEQKFPLRLSRGGSAAQSIYEYDVGEKKKVSSFSERIIEVHRIEPGIPGAVRRERVEGLPSNIKAVLELRVF